MGIVARRRIPTKYRIIVEAVYTSPLGHPPIEDLMPVGGTMLDKFNLNQTTGDPSRDSGRPQLGLRISRLNHDCDPNAGYNYCDASRVQILYANRDILKGEEICISYLITST